MCTTWAAAKGKDNKTPSSEAYWLHQTVGVDGIRKGEEAAEKETLMEKEVGVFINRLTRSKCSHASNQNSKTTCD